MHPHSPVIRELAHAEVILAKDQPEYLQLPVLHRHDREGGIVLSRWRPTLRERVRLLFGADLFLQVMTHGDLMQPIKPTIGFDPEED